MIRRYNQDLVKILYNKKIILVFIKFSKKSVAKDISVYGQQCIVHPGCVIVHRRYHIVRGLHKKFVQFLNLSLELSVSKFHFSDDKPVCNNYQNV